jgi:hypothetical protein
MCTRGVHASLASSTYGRGLPGRRSCLEPEHVLRGSPSPALWALLLRDRNSMVGPWPYTQQATTRGGGICGPVQPSNTIHGWRTDMPALACYPAATVPSRHTQPPPGHGCSVKSWLYVRRVLSIPFIRSPQGTHFRGSDYLAWHAAVNVKRTYPQLAPATCTPHRSEGAVSY